jgi:hypothetical protein
MSAALILYIAASLTSLYNAAKANGFLLSLLWLSGGVLWGQNAIIQYTKQAGNNKQ